MSETDRQKLERRVQNRLGYISNVADLPEATLLALLEPEPDLSVLDRPAEPRAEPYDPRPLHEQIIGFRLW